MTCIAEVTELGSGHGPTQEGKVPVKAVPPRSLSGGWRGIVGAGLQSWEKGRRSGSRGLGKSNLRARR